MGDTTEISWADKTFNPWMGCTKVSPACANCYAERDMDHRLNKVKWGLNGNRMLTSDSNWKKPLKWNRDYTDQCRALSEDMFERDISTLLVEPPRPRVFCASLADVFEVWQGPIVNNDNERMFLSWAIDGPWEPESKVDSKARPPVTMDDVRKRLFKLFASTPNLDKLVLTKRPENIVQRIDRTVGLNWWKENCAAHVWLGTSVESQEYADKRIPELLKCRGLSPCLWLSCEPLLGELDLSDWLGAERDRDFSWRVRSKFGEKPLIDWVIAGGESGPNARPSHPQWFRTLRDQCKAASVPFHFKQWGEYIPDSMVDDSGFLRRIEMYKSGKCGVNYCRFFDGNNLIPAGGGCSSEELTTMFRVGVKEAGRMLDGVVHDEFPLIVS